jgi:signal transduction histidine kinase
MQTINSSDSSIGARIAKNVALVKILISNSEMMQNLMMDLLDLAQMENNTFKLNKAFFSLSDAIKQAYQVVCHTAENKNL